MIPPDTGKRRKKGTCASCSRPRLLVADLCFYATASVLNGPDIKRLLGGLAITLRLNHGLCASCTRKLSDAVVHLSYGGVQKRLTRKQATATKRRRDAVFRRTLKVKGF
jgi:hypothetical protein